MLEEDMIFVIKHLFHLSFTPFEHSPAIYFIKYIKLQSNLIHMAILLSHTHFPGGSQIKNSTNRVAEYL